MPGLLTALNRRQFLGAAAAAATAAVSRAAGDAARWRVGVIGHTGRGNYGHGLDTMWLQLPETRIVAVADADARGLEGALRRLNVSAGYADYRQMLGQARPQVVAIGPRHIDQHRDMVLAAVSAGARAIYLEKPFCRTPAEADEIVAACEQHRVRLAVAHRNRWHPVLPVLQQRLAGGLIGRVLEIRARGKEDHRGGVLDLWVLGSHLLNLATVFAGPPQACTATVLQDGRPVTRADLREGDEGVGPLAGNAVHARFETAAGIPVFFDSLQRAGVASAGFGLQVIGTRGVLDLRVDQEPLAHYLEGNPFEPGRSPRSWVPVTSGGVGRPEPVAHLGRLLASHVLPARDLLAAVDEEREPLCGARDGALTVEMICAVLESHRRGGARVPLPLAAREHPFSRW